MLANDIYIYIYISLPQSLDLPTEFFIGICTALPFGESFVGNFLSVGKSVSNKKILLQMDLLTEKTGKKITRFIPSEFPWKNTICNSVSNYLKIFLKNLFYKTIK
jgi:hypothetical protein